MHSIAPASKASHWGWVRFSVIAHCLGGIDRRRCGGKGQLNGLGAGRALLDLLFANADLFHHRPKLIGLRPMIQDIADDAWMLSDAIEPAIPLPHRSSCNASIIPRWRSCVRASLRR